MRAGAWAETAVVPDLEAVLDWTWAPWRPAGASASPGTTSPSSPCAPTGGTTPAAPSAVVRSPLALAEAAPEQTWEVSHIGGDRFAGNLLVLPARALLRPARRRTRRSRLAADHAAGRLDLDHLRGRSSLPMPVQAAEIALRRTLEEPGTTAVTFAGRTVDGPLTVARFAVGGTSYAVTVRTSLSAQTHPLTCSAVGDSPLPRHEILAIDPVDG